MKKLIINFLKSNSLSLIFLSFIYSIPCLIRIVGAPNNKIIFKGAFLKNTKIRIKGKNNKVIINSENRLTNCLIHISGDNCTIEIGEHCILNNLELWIEDDGGKIKIGYRTTIEGGHIAATEGEKISIGNDCMFSGGIQIRNGDSHPIFDLLSKERINYARKVVIGEHVWLGADVKILKGSIIQDNSIVGSGSIVTGILDSNSIYAGVPVKKVKDSINWERHR